MSFVLDASISGCWAFDDEVHPVADAALDRTCRDEIIVPSLWWFETRNILIMAERRNRFTPARTSAFLVQLKRLNLAIDSTLDSDAIMSLTRRHGLTVYDASYLELAVRAAVPIATLDRKLAAAAQSEGVPLIA